MDIEVRDLQFAYGRKQILTDISVTFTRGKVTALLGPNGAGKSTLLRLVSGELKLQSGSILFDGQPLFHWKSADLAKRRAFLAQQALLDFDFTVFEVVLMGRSPHGGETGQSSESIALQALQCTDMAEARERAYTTLSGGERQRVQLARVLAQVWNKEGTALLLDEPIAGLDLAHQHAALSLARDWAKAGATVITILHDLNLALQYADEAILLHHGRIHSHGPVIEALQPANIEAVFSVSAEWITREAQLPIIQIGPRKRV